MNIPSCKPMIVGALLLFVLMAPGQTQQRSEAFSIDAFPGEARVMRSQGRVLVDVEDLARITKGSLRFDGNKIILTLPLEVPTSAGNDAPQTGFPAHS